MDHAFTGVLTQKPKYNLFDLSHQFKYTFDMGGFVPITKAIELVPGDRVKTSVSTYLKMAPMIAPIFHEIYIKHYAFFVPYRLLWDGADEFIADPTASTAVPYINLGPANIVEGDVGDYMRYPLTVPAATFQVDALPGAGYALIWDEWIRDQNLQAEVFTPLVTGANNWVRTVLTDPPFPVNWKLDYFTSAFTTAQRGASVVLPILQDPAVITLDDTATNPGKILKASDQSVITTGYGLSHNSTSIFQNDAGVPDDVVYDPDGTLILPTDATFSDLNTLRNAFRLQEYLELSMFAGTRYHEFVWAFFNVRTADSRVGRPEFIGMTTDRMNISQVMQTAPASASAESADTPLGSYAGAGQAVAGGRSFNYYATEHGYLYMFITVCPKPSYSSQGCPRSYRRFLDGSLSFYNYKFAHLGEQAIYNYELYMQATDELNFGTWGYNPKYSEYRVEMDAVAGEFRSSLDHWDLTRRFSAFPALNSDFITVPSADDANEENMKRIFAVDYGGSSEFANHMIYAWSKISIRKLSKMPLFGQPMI